MQQLIMFDKNDFDDFKKSLIEEVRQIVQTQKQPSVKQTKLDKTLEEIDNYVPFKVALKKLGISDDTWRRSHKHVIQWKKDDGKNGRVWVYLPSILQYLKKDNIND